MQLKKLSQMTFAKGGVAVPGDRYCILAHMHGSSAIADQGMKGCEGVNRTQGLHY